MIFDYAEQQEDITEINNWKQRVEQIYEQASGAKKSPEMILSEVKESLKRKYGDQDHILGKSFDQVLEEYLPDLEGVP